MHDTMAKHFKLLFKINNSCILSIYHHFDNYTKRLFPIVYILVVHLLMNLVVIITVKYLFSNGFHAARYIMCMHDMHLLLKFAVTCTELPVQTVT